MSAKAATPPSFEDALGELETIVKGLESGKTTLDESISAYARGVELKKICEAKLREAQSKIDMIVPQADSSITTKPFSEG